MVSNLKLKGCIAVYIILTSVYYGTGVLRFTLDSVNMPISVGAMYTMYRYLDTRPAVHKTMMNSLMKIMVICLSIQTMRGYVWSFLMNVIHQTLRELVLNHPTLICSLSNPRFTFVPLVMIGICLLMTKLFLVLLPHHFFNFNHEQGTRVCLVLSVSAIVVEVTTSLIIRGHCCNQMYFTNLKKRLEVQTEASTVQIFPWLLILVIIGVLAELTSNTVLQYRAWKQSRNVAPAPQPRLFIVSHNNPNNPAPVVSGLGHNQETQNCNEIKLTQNIAMIFGLLEFLLAWLNFLTSSISNQQINLVFMNLHIIFIQVSKSLLPLVWVTSCDETIEFASRMLKDKILLCPQGIQNMASRFINLHEMN